MNTATLQPRQTSASRYPTTERIVQNSEKILSEKEEILQSIAFWKQYMEDLKAGRPVENVHPDNDPYFLVPANIAAIIRGEEDLLHGRVRVIESVDKLWADLGIE